MRIDKVQPHILGTLYIDNSGDIMLLNDEGAHTILIEDRQRGLPGKIESMLYVRSCEVNWDVGSTEFWAEDLWYDLMEDSREEYGAEYTEELKLKVKSNFQSLILTTTT
jgi:hypothetical protein